jgi:hypothetical protein
VEYRMPIGIEDLAFDEGDEFDGSAQRAIDGRGEFAKRAVASSSNNGPSRWPS